MSEQTNQTPAPETQANGEKPKRKHGGGRPTKYTPERVARFLEAIRAGSSREGACRYAGIGISTLYEWLADPNKAEFVEALENEEGALERRLAGVVQAAAADGNWQAAMTMLERKWPEWWSRRERSRVELSGPDGKPVNVATQVTLDVDAVQEIMNVLAAAGALKAATGGDSAGGAAAQ